MITAEIAREFQRRGVEARKARQKERALLEALQASVAIQQPITPVTPDSYLTERLMRVRKQLDQVDAMMLTEDDPQRLDRLASAQMRLSEQERILAGRPLPGSRKPAPDRADRRQGRAIVIYDEPLPVASAALPVVTVPPSPSVPQL